MKLGATRIGYGGFASPWDSSSNMRFLTGGVTIDPNTVPRRNRKTGLPDPKGARIVWEGDILGKITATGLWGPYDSNAADGRQVARCLAAGTYNLDDGYPDTISESENGTTIGGVDMGRILRRRMSVQYTDPELETIKEQLLKNGAFITFVESRGTPGPALISVTLEPATINLAVGETATIHPIWEPLNAANKHGDFTTSALNIAIVGTYNTPKGAVGSITALAVGNAQITFRALDGGHTATMAVNVA